MHATPTRTTRTLALLAVLLLAAVALALPHGRMAPMGEVRWDPTTGRHVFEHDMGRMAVHGVANAAGTLAFLLTAFGAATAYVTRPWVRKLHAPMGVGILALALAHTLIYVADGSLRGWAPGTLALVAFAFHGATGAWKRACVRAWGAGWWRFAHRGSAWAAIALTVQHILVASWHWGFARWFEENGWS